MLLAQAVALAHEQILQRLDVRSGLKRTSQYLPKLHRPRLNVLPAQKQGLETCNVAVCLLALSCGRGLGSARFNELLAGCLQFGVSDSECLLYVRSRPEGILGSREILGCLSDTLLLFGQLASLIDTRWQLGELGGVRLKRTNLSERTPCIVHGGFWVDSVTGQRDKRGGDVLVLGPPLLRCCDRAVEANDLPVCSGDAPLAIPAQRADRNRTDIFTGQTTTRFGQATGYLLKGGCPAM